MKTNMSIYLAEDDEDDAMLFKEAIAGMSSGVYLTILCNGDKLMKLLAVNEVLPDVIFLDLNMPLKDGFKCLEEIKEHTAWRNIRTVILSTTSDDRQVKKCYSLGADTFITKSPNYHEYRLNIERCLLK
jgi:CheY-like chemotaxis protein